MSVKACRSLGRYATAQKAGFSLIELLVVIVILGVVAGMVTLSTAPAENRRMAEEMDRLAALFRLAHDEARISGRRILWEADESGYRFVALDGVLGVDNPDDPLRPRAWPFAVSSIDAPPVEFGGEPLLVPVRISVLTAENQLTLELDEFGELRVPQ